MSFKDRTTSVKLDPELRARLGWLAHATHRSVHAMMKEAIARYAHREEVRLWEACLAEQGKIPNAPGVDTAAAHMMPVMPGGLPPHVLAQIAAGNNRLRVIRGWRGMDYGRLIAAIEDMGSSVSESALAAFEEGTWSPGAGLIAMLARALNVTVEELMG